MCQDFLKVLKVLGELRLIIVLSKGITSVIYNLSNRIHWDINVLYFKLFVIGFNVFLMWFLVFCECCNNLLLDYCCKLYWLMTPILCIYYIYDICKWNAMSIPISSPYRLSLRSIYKLLNTAFRILRVILLDLSWCWIFWGSHNCDLLCNLNLLMCSLSNRILLAFCILTFF
jgi:hypothetical protein